MIRIVPRPRMSDGRGVSVVREHQRGARNRRDALMLTHDGDTPAV